MPDIDAHRNHRILFDDHTFDDFGAGADEAVVFDNGRVGLHRFQYAADADTAGQMDILADLRTGSDRGPPIDHRAFIDKGADIDEGWHQHHVFADEAAATYDRAGYHAKAAIGEKKFEKYLPYLLTAFFFIWINNLMGIIPSITGKIELVYEGEQEGPYQVAFNLLEKAIRTLFATYFPNPDTLKKKRTKEVSTEENPYKAITRWFDGGNHLIGGV